MLADQAKRREESVDIDRKHLEIAQQISESEAEMERQFMSLMQQMMALMIQSLGAQGFPSPTPMGYQPGPVFSPWTTSQDRASHGQPVSTSLHDGGDKSDNWMLLFTLLFLIVLLIMFYYYNMKYSEFK